ncbi:MAG TPA: oxidoreductase C-terminal domain-containing protein, partial [Streptomyces sp.]
LRGTHRIEHWTNAQEHGAAAARNMLGAATPYTAVPWFWTQQYGSTLQSCGDVQDDDTMAVSGDLGALDFAAVAQRAGRTAAVVCGNRPAEFRGLRAALGEPPAGAHGSPGEFGTVRNGPSAFKEATSRSTL